MVGWYTTIKVIRWLAGGRHKYFHLSQQSGSISAPCNSCLCKIDPGEKFLVISASARGDITLCADCAYAIAGDIRKSLKKKDRDIAKAKKVVEDL